LEAREFSGPIDFPNTRVGIYEVNDSLTIYNDTRSRMGENFAPDEKK